MNNNNNTTHMLLWDPRPFEGSYMNYMFLLVATSPIPENEGNNTSQRDQSSLIQMNNAIQAGEPILSD